METQRGCCCCPRCCNSGQVRSSGGNKTTGNFLARTASQMCLCAAPRMLPLSEPCRSPSCRLQATLAHKGSAKRPALQDTLIRLQDTHHRLFGDLCFTGLCIPRVNMFILLCSFHLCTMASKTSAFLVTKMCNTTHNTSFCNSHGKLPCSYH